MTGKNYGNNSQLAELMKYISDNIKFPLMGAGGGFAPIGTESYFDGTSAPQGWLLCNGQTLNITDYPELAAYFASHHGSSNYYGGNGTTTFALPTRKGMPNNEDDNHNTSEHIVGVWTNNKPLYQKTIDCGMAPNATTKNIAHGISNIETIVKYTGYTKYSNIDAPIPFPDTISIGGVMTVFRDGNNIVLQTGSDRTAWHVYITIQYTKTTDSAVAAGHSADGNGVFCIKATVAGDPNGHQYSTEEHVVGQWIDGKTLYEKTVVCATPAKDTDSYIPIGAIIDTVVDYNAMFKNIPLNGAGVNNWIKAGSQAMKMGVTDVEGVNVHIRGNDSTDGNQNTIHIRHNATNWGTKPLYVTIRYTKVS